MEARAQAYLVYAPVYTSPEGVANRSLNQLTQYLGRLRTQYPLSEQELALAKKVKITTSPIQRDLIEISGNDLTKLEQLQGREPQPIRPLQMFWEQKQAEELFITRVVEARSSNVENPKKFFSGKDREEIHNIWNILGRVYTDTTPLSDETKAAYRKTLTAFADRLIQSDEPNSLRTFVLAELVLGKDGDEKLREKRPEAFEQERIEQVVQSLFVHQESSPAEVRATLGIAQEIYSHILGLRRKSIFQPSFALEQDTVRVSSLAPRRSVRQDQFAQMTDQYIMIGEGTKRIESIVPALLKKSIAAAIKKSKNRGYTIVA